MVRALPLTALCMISLRQKKQILIDKTQIMSKQLDSKNTENSNELYTLLGVVTSNEITSIDKRIKSCMIENKEEPNDEIYVKIWFNYRIGNNHVNPDGRQEFVADTKETLIKEIQDFMKVKKDGWFIL